MTVTSDEPLTGAAVRDAVGALVPALRAAAVAAEHDRRVPTTSIAALEGAGVFRMTVPRRFGGLELDLVEQIDVLTEIGRGCGSTAWVASLHSVCGYFVGKFDDRAQEDVWASDPDARVAGIFSPGGTLTPVDGGYRLRGRWPFNTGCRSAQWDTLAAAVVDPSTPDGPPDLQLALVEMSELTIEDDWDPSGLAATGSNAVTATDVFVPSHRLLPMGGALQGLNLSTTTADSELYRNAFFCFVMVNSTGAPLGIAKGAMDAFLERLPGRRITYTDWVQSEALSTHIGVADAAATITTAELLSQDLARRMRDAAAAGRDLTTAERTRIRAEVAHVVKLCRDAVSTLQHMSSASSIQRDLPLQRCHRDIEALSLHAALALNPNLEVHGRVLVGMDPGTPFL